MRSYQTIEITRADAITQLRFHTEGGPLKWSPTSYEDAYHAFTEVGDDPDTKVVVITGTGEEWCTVLDTAGFRAAGRKSWEHIWWEGRMLTRLVEINVPIIGVVNGPALVHAEVPLFADIRIGADTSVFADDRHFSRDPGTVPGDGVHVIWPYLLGRQRAKYFLTMNQRIEADEALRLGVLNEVLPAGEVQARGREIAERFARKSLALLRYTRETLNIYERTELLRGLGHGRALEGLGVEHSPPTHHQPGATA
jgi:enoyl-CoA hydratase/carnithine racemase